MQVYFEEQFNNRKKKEQDKKSKSLFQARIDRFSSKINVEELKNKVGTLLMKQEFTNQRLSLQNEQTIKILQHKFQIEQQRIRKKQLEDINQQLIEEKRQQCQKTKNMIFQNIQENLSKIQYEKKENRNMIFEESKNNDNEKDLIKQKEYLEKKYISNLVRENKNTAKNNINKFWDYKIQMNELNRRKMIYNQVKSKNFQDEILEKLKQKEMSIQQMYELTKEKQNEQQKLMQEARSMSTKQFQELYPSYYNNNLTEIQKSLETGAFTTLQTQNKHNGTKYATKDSQNNTAHPKQTPYKKNQNKYTKLDPHQNDEDEDELDKTQIIEIQRTQEVDNQQSKELLDLNFQQQQQQQQQQLVQNQHN